MSNGVLVAIVGGVVLVLAILVTVGVLGAQLVGGLVSSITSGPALVEGDDAEPLARVPLECVQQCFTVDSIGATIPPSSTYRRIGLTTTLQEWGDYETSTPAEEHAFRRDEWRDADIHPDECYFRQFAAPVAIPFGEVASSSELDTVEYTEGRSSQTELSTLFQSVRLLDSSASAEAHMRSLDDQTHACTTLSAAGAPDTTLTPTPALELPSSVSAIGWVESSPGWRYYVIDVQRGNLVVRSMLSTTSTEVSEKQFRGFVEELAVQVAEIELSAP